jgi:puromycin-sensitive aminopeptidase
MYKIQSIIKIFLKPIKEVKDFKIYSNLSEFYFERSPIMSTYLVAFVVGEFDYVEERCSQNTLVRVYTPVGKLEMGKFSLDVIFKLNYPIHLI